MHDLETKLRSLLNGEYTCLNIGFNEDHASSYLTVEEWVELTGDSDHLKSTWISGDELKRSIVTNAVWSIQVYPTTPIGSYTIRAASLEALIAALPS